MTAVILTVVGVGFSLAVILILWGMAVAAKRADEALEKMNRKNLE